LGTDDPVSYSDNPAFVSLKFAENDSIANIENAVFTLEYDVLLDDSIIVNLDSLPYQTRIDSVNPTFSFKSSGGTLIYFKNGDSKGVSGTDTIDFNEVEKIENTAADGIKSRTYFVRVNVHQVEPELYVWDWISESVNSINAIQQKAVIFNDTLFYYLNDNVASYLYTSSNGYDWNPKDITGLPANAQLNDLVLLNGKLFVSNNNDKLYSSQDGQNWVEKTYSNYDFKSLVFVLNDSLRAVTQSKSDSKYRFASSKDGENWIVRENDVLPDFFPISDFTAHSFFSRSGKHKGIVVGGKSANGNTLKSNWSTEGKYVNGQMYWTNFSLENHNLDTLALGSSIISYDDKLLLFGVRNDKDEYVNYYKVSKDEGFSWQTPDTLKNVLPDNYSPRTFHSVVVFKPLKYSSSESYTKEGLINSNRIFVIGGKTETNTLTDVWTGKLNRKSFFRQ
jgi:hypothetical protein